MSLTRKSPIGPRAALLAAAAAAIAACSTGAEPPAPVSAASTAPAVPAGMQWLYGSGEGAATNIQTWRAFADYVVAAAAQPGTESVVLAPGASLDQPRFTACAGKPKAVVLDVDETALLNLGYEYDQARQNRSFDPVSWDLWEKTGARQVAPLPGVAAALQAVRRANVTVVFNTNRKATNAQATADALNLAGLGPARHGETLFLSGDLGSGSDKDSRRAAVAERYCVLAMAGDQLGDFTDLFNAKDLSVPARRRASMESPVSRLWGAGWFVLSNPVYGSGLKGGLDDVFPADKRWPEGAQ